MVMAQNQLSRHRFTEAKKWVKFEVAGRAHTHRLFALLHSERGEWKLA